MALAYGDFNELSHQLRFLLFEIGIGLSQQSIDHFIDRSQSQSMQQLLQAVMNEGLVKAPMAKLPVHSTLKQLKGQLKKTQPESVFFDWQGLEEDIHECIANEAMASAYRQIWQQRLKQETQAHGSLWMGLVKQYSARECLLLLEQWGHSTPSILNHDPAKMRLNRREVIQYSPEFNAEINLHWCALKQPLASTLPGQFSYLQALKHCFPQALSLWRDKLIFQGHNPDHFYPVPVHPWQWRNQISNEGSKLIDNKDLILLPHHQKMRSLSSSTLMPNNPEGCYLKLAPIAHHGFARGNPAKPLSKCLDSISTRINKIVNHNEAYQGRITFIPNLAGLKMKEDQTIKQQPLSLTLKAHPAHQLKADDRVVPLSALFTDSPHHDLPLLIEIIQASGLYPVDYFKRYCEFILRDQMHLLFTQGVSLGASENNTLIVFSHHLPRQLVIRDLYQVKICNPEYQHRMDIDEVRHQFILHNLMNNIAHWIQCLNQHYKIESSSLWQQVFQMIKSMLEDLRKEVDPTLFEHHVHALLNEPWQLKCLLSMRLNQSKTDTIYYPWTNPFSKT